MKNNNKGLTLIELLIAIAIIAVLLLITLSLYRSQMQRGRDGRRKADLAKVQKALEDYMNDHICYPNTLDCRNDFSPYLSLVPCDPLNTGNNIYFYSVSGTESCKKWYKIFTTLEYSKDPIIEKIGCTSVTCGAYNYLVSSPNVESTKRQLGEIYPWGEPSPTPTLVPTPTSGGPTPTLVPTPTPGGPTPTSGPSTPTPTPGGPTPTSGPSTPTPIPPCPAGWHTCIDQGGKCNVIPSYLPGAVCNTTCNAGSGSCSATSCSPSCI